jgi:hypothetical protein
VDLETLPEIFGGGRLAAIRAVRLYIEIVDYDHFVPFLG